MNDMFRPSSLVLRPIDLPRADLPLMARARQNLPNEALDDLEGEILRSLDEAGLRELVRTGMRVALTAGSRGIAEIPRILASVVRAVREAGGEPFIVPAMGSHGGATVEGQLVVLHGYGITEESVGAPILATMETVELGQTASGATLHQDRHAAEADATIMVARVKAHTSFRSDIESGLCKMLSIGLGKQRGAESVHAHDLAESIKQVASLAIERSNVALGLALVENASHQIYLVRAVRPEDFHDADRELLKLSNSLLPRVPFDELDVLVVGELGKNISGSGMDPNVIGMWRRTGDPPAPPLYKRVVVLDVTDESDGNALGVGLADFTTDRLVKKMDLRKSYMNALTADGLVTVRLPVILDSDREAIEVALKSSGADGQAGMVWIRNTLALEEMLISEALLPEAEASGAFAIVEAPRTLEFDGQGSLKV
jgi:hypothetical protein